ncbi:hypothetical protein [Nonomuraea dietziae]|uniref:hypothetical protein n=1 Tax=Nonomuraea dietziae TaxID=65515 RepID=UPI0033E2ECA6
MALTVGELVAYATIDKDGFGRGTRGIAADLRSLQTSTTGTMQSMETTVTRSLADIERAIADGLDPAEAIRDLDRLEASLDQSLRDMEADADRFADELDRAMDEAFDNLDQKRYGELDFEVHADISAALAALNALEAAGENAGERAGDGFVRGADGRLRDARGKFVKSGEDLFGPLVDGATDAGKKTGDALGDGVSVIGKAGPANVAIAVAAIELLPTVASLAASGVVLAFGGAMAAVGIQAAAGSDRVKKAWKDLGDDIKDELADAAKPLEESLVEAADKIGDAFDDLDLGAAFEAMKPGIDRFVDGAAAGIREIADLLEPLGDSFGTMIGNLGDRMPEIMANVEEAVRTFMEIMDEDPQMLADLVEDATELLAVGAEVLSWADEMKVAFSLLIGQPRPLAEQLGLDPLTMQAETLPNTLRAMDRALKASQEAHRELGEGANEAEAGVRALSQALEQFFDPAAKALDAEIRLREALKKTAEAAKDSKLTDIERLQSVRDITSAIAGAATAEQERTDKTDKASKAFADQLPRLVDLAGKNDAARDAVVGLGNSLGATIKRTDDGKVALDKFGKAVVTLPNGKQIKIDADTARALAGLKDTKGKTEELKDKKLKVDADTKAAVGEVKKVKTGLDGLKGDAERAGRDLGSGLTSGIRSMIGDAIAAAKSLAASALKGAKDFLGIKSPSTVMAEVGKWTAKGLIKGLQDEEGNVKSTVERMVEQVKEAFGSKPDVADHLLDFIKLGNKNLEGLALQREALVQRLADAKEYAKKVAGDAGEWASIMGMSKEEIEAGDISGSLKSRAQAIKDFANDVKRLAERGLNKTTLRQIIDAGVEKGATIADMLVGADGSEIKAINKAQKQIDNMSKQLGKTGADALYDVGKKAGDGYLKGLQESLKALDAEMAKIVKALVRAIKKELKIKSPSQVMADIGVDTIAGWIVGIESMGGQAMAAMQKVASSAVKGTIPLDPAMGSLKPLAGGLRDVGDVSQHGYTVPKDGSGTEAGRGVTVNVDLSGSTIREETDIHKISKDVGFTVMARGVA